LKILMLKGVVDVENLFQLTEMVYEIAVDRDVNEVGHYGVRCDCMHRK